MIARAGARIAGASLAVLLLAACATPAPNPLVLERPPVLPPLPEQQIIAPPALGSDAEIVRAEYGLPDFVRREPEAELWRYDGNDCALFVFLYRDEDAFVLRYLETMPAGTDGTADTECLQSVKDRAAPVS